MYRNTEGYLDPTAGQALRNVQVEEEGKRLEAVSALVLALRAQANAAGFEIIGRIPLRHIKSGKQYK